MYQTGRETLTEYKTLVSFRCSIRRLSLVLLESTAIWPAISCQGKGGRAYVRSRWPRRSEGIVSRERVEADSRPRACALAGTTMSIGCVKGSAWLPLSHCAVNEAVQPGVATRLSTSRFFFISERSPDSLIPDWV